MSIIVAILELQAKLQLPRGIADSIV